MVMEDVYETAGTRTIRDSWKFAKQLPAGRFKACWNWTVHPLWSRKQSSTLKHLEYPKYRTKNLTEIWTSKLKDWKIPTKSKEYCLADRLKNARVHKKNEVRSCTTMAKTSSWMDAMVDHAIIQGQETEKVGVHRIFVEAQEVKQRLTSNLLPSIWHCCRKNNQHDKPCTNAKKCHCTTS